MDELQSAILECLLRGPVFLYAGLAVYAFLRRRDQLSITFGLMMGLCSMLALTYSYEISADSLEAKITWMKVKFFFGPFIPLCWLFISLQLVGPPRWFRPILWKLLLIVPVLTPVFALTTQHHEWFRHHFVLEPLGHLQILHFQTGPWMHLYTSYWHLVGIMGILVLLTSRWEASPVVRRQIDCMLAAYILPSIIDLFFHLGKTPLEGLNLAHVFLVPSSLLAAWVVFHHRLLNLAPIARSALFDHMKEGVVVLDCEGRVADLNTRAEQLLGAARLHVLGETPGKFKDPWPALFASNPPSARAYIENGNAEPQWVECSYVELFDERSASVGRLYLLRDVTGTVLREDQALQLTKLNAERQRLGEQEYLMQDLHDGLGALSANVGMMAARGMREHDPATKDRLLKQINQLACEIGMEVREIMISLESREFYWGDFVHSLRRYAAMVLEVAGLEWNLTVAGEVPSTGPGYSAGISLLRVMREVLNNLVRHADAQSVQINVGFFSERCMIDIQDDGKGFDPEQPRTAGHGLTNIRNRIEAMGGTMQLQTSASGTRLLFSLPLPLARRVNSLSDVDDTAVAG